MFLCQIVIYFLTNFPQIIYMASFHALLLALADLVKICDVEIYKIPPSFEVHTPTNALFIELHEVLKFTLKTTSTCSYMFRSLTL